MTLFVVRLAYRLMSTRNTVNLSSLSSRQFSKTLKIQIPFQHSAVWIIYIFHSWFLSQELLLVELSNLLSNAAQSENARKAAAIQLKNYLTSKDESVKIQYQQRWLTFDANNKQGIKNNVITVDLLLFLLFEKRVSTMWILPFSL